MGILPKNYIPGAYSVGWPLWPVWVFLAGSVWYYWDYFSVLIGLTTGVVEVVT